MVQESFIGLADVESVYRDFKTNGVLIAGYIFAYLVAFILLVFNLLKKYKKDVASGKIDAKKILELLNPILPYVILVSTFPVLISGFEWILAQIERSILTITGYNPTVDIMEAWTDEYDKISGLNLLKADLSWVFGYLGVQIVKPIVVLIDSYLFSLVLAGRYLWLILLEFHAPFAIISLLSNESNEVFRTWLKNMYKCFLYVPGFMIANYFAEGLFKSFFGAGDYNMFVVLFLISVKLYLYKYAANKINTIV